MSREAPLRVGQIGVGNYGGHRRVLLRKSKRYEVAAVFDINEQFLRKAAAEESAKACKSYEELLKTPGLDAVIISTGARFHGRQIIKALQCGLPVFVEKPLCATRDELAEILRLQRETGLPIGVGHDDLSRRADTMTIKRLIDEGALGTVVAFEKTTAHSGGMHIRPGDWRGVPEENPGGILFHCGVHGLHELMYYFGSIIEVSARLRFDVHTTRTADAAICHLVFESGLIGTLCAYHVTPYRHTFSIFGTQMNLYRDEFHVGKDLKIFKQRVHPEGGFEPQELLKVSGEDVEEGSVLAFYDAVRTGEMRHPSLFDGARAVAVVFAAEESARLGRAVKVESMFQPKAPAKVLTALS